MAMAFLDSAPVTREPNRNMGTETFRAARDGLEMISSDVIGKKNLFIGGVGVHNESIVSTVFDAMKKKWMASIETDEQRLAKFKQAMAIGPKFTPEIVLERVNERGERTRTRVQT